MKKLLYSFVVLSLTIYFGCSNNLVSPPISSTSNEGQVELKISSDSIPNGVVKVTAVLIQSGADTLIESTNPITSSSASIVFTNVSVGTWHLIVNAEDSSGDTLYTGETDIHIQAGITTQVNLNLIPTGNGTGNISITVNWGNTGSNWLDYSNNPVFTIYQNPSYPNAVSQGKIIYEDGVYKMWYMCTYNAGKGNIWYAESADGINWVNKTSAPVFASGPEGSWDDYSVGTGAVIKDSNTFKLYYISTKVSYGRSNIGLATSTDGIHWQRYTNPVLLSDSTDEYHIGTESVLKVNGTYYMYYSASPAWNYNQFVIGLATSSDGVNWKKYSGNPVLSPTLQWEGIGVLYPAVIYDNNRFIMIYSNTDRTKFGIAYSNDGMNWTKSTTPTFTVSDTQKNLLHIDYPFLIKIGNEYKLYYTGTFSDNSLAICFATSLTLN